MSIAHRATSLCNKSCPDWACEEKNDDRLSNRSARKDHKNGKLSGRSFKTSALLTARIRRLSSEWLERIFRPRSLQSHFLFGWKTKHTHTRLRGDDSLDRNLNTKKEQSNQILAPRRQIQLWVICGKLVVCLICGS